MDQYFRRNTFGISSVEFLWGLGMPVVVESTFLQLFLRNLGASNFLIGLIPTLFSGGVAVFALFLVDLGRSWVHNYGEESREHLPPA